jgi:predicted NBD/HSP70 family sugar kinase
VLVNRVELRKENVGMPILWQSGSWACLSCGERGVWECPSSGKGDHGNAHPVEKGTMGMPIQWQRGPWACPSSGKGDHGHAHPVAKGTMGMPIILEEGPWACPSCSKQFCVELSSTSLLTHSEPLAKELDWLSITMQIPLNPAKPAYICNKHKI